jgi:hypothetical protein
MRITYAYNHCFTIIAATITSTLPNGQTTVVGSIIYQYGNDDNAGGSQVIKNGGTSPVRQVADFLRLVGGWGLFACVTMVMVMVVAA